MLGGIFVGGAGRRMGGLAKGMLRAPSGETIVAYLARTLRAAGLEPVLVGARSEYASLGIPSIEDSAANAGPLGGLVALLEAARGDRVVAIACDMPRISSPLVKKLVSAPDAAVVAPRRDGHWEPLFARYDSARVLDPAKARCARAELTLQKVLDEVGAVALAISPDEAAMLDDWDTPEDVSAANPLLAAATSSVAVTAFDGGTSSLRPDRVATEEPLEIRGNGEPVAVTMRTPGSDVELAAGFLLGEGVVRARSDIVSITQAGAHTVIVDLVDEARARLPSAERRFFTTSSCGVCDKSSLERVRAVLPEVRPARVSLDPESIARMPEMLRAAQSIFDRTGGLHAAGLFRATRPPELVRLAEDVGRHNAVDKILGGELLAGHVPLAAEGYVLVLSGRIAFELVQKAALAAVSAIVAVGAPTSLAVELGEAAGITLVGFARGQRFNVYTGGARVNVP